MRKIISTLLGREDWSHYSVISYNLHLQCISKSSTDVSLLPQFSRTFIFWAWCFIVLIKYYLCQNSVKGRIRDLPLRENTFPLWGNVDPKSPRTQVILTTIILGATWFSTTGANASWGCKKNTKLIFITIFGDLPVSDGKEEGISVSSIAEWCLGKVSKQQKLALPHKQAASERE